MLRALLLSLMLATIGASADAQTPRTAAAPRGLGITTSAFAQRFNDAARRINMPVRAVETQCQPEGEILHCVYSITAGLGILGTTARDRRTLNELTLALFAGSSADAAVKFIASFAVLAALLEPQADAPERGAALFALGSVPGSSDLPQYATARLRNTQFTLRSREGAGTIITAVRAE